MATLTDSGTVLSLVLGCALITLFIWLAWRRPALTIMPALAILAIRPELLWGGPAMDHRWGLQQTLLAVALLVQGQRFGVVPAVNWPILALLIVCALSLLFGEVRSELTPGLMLASLALLSLPFACTQVIFAPRRGSYEVAIMVIPLLSVVLGLVLQWSGIRTTFAGLDDRLEGATGNAGPFAMLAFAGFAVSLHVIARCGQGRAMALAGVNAALVILSGSRTGLLATLALAASYIVISSNLRAILRARPLLMLGSALLMATALALYGPKLLSRWSASFDRIDVWTFFYRDFLVSPLFGRGFGSGFATGFAWPEGLERPVLSVPHNEYLHLAVIGGAVGLVLCLIAVCIWYRGLIRSSGLEDRRFLYALAPALLLYGMTDNILFNSTALPIYAYLGVMTRTLSPLPDVAGAAKADEVPLPNRGHPAATPGSMRSGLH